MEPNQAPPPNIAVQQLHEMTRQLHEVVKQVHESNHRLTRIGNLLVGVLIATGIVALFVMMVASKL